MLIREICQLAILCAGPVSFHSNVTGACIKDKLEGACIEDKLEKAVDKIQILSGGMSIMVPPDAMQT